MFLNQNSSSELKAQLTTAVATSQLEISVTYKDNTDVYHPDALVATNDTTAVTLLAAPSGAVVNIVELIKIYNPDTQANTVQIVLGSSVVFTVALGAGQSAIISEEGIHTSGYVAADADLSNLTTAGKAKVSHLAMPSSSSVNVTLGATGSTYTAPADGYYSIQKASGASNEYLNLINATIDNFKSTTWSSAAGQYWALTLPVKKNDVLWITYTFSGVTDYFKFFYAEGSKP